MNKYSKQSLLEYFHKTSGVISQPTPDEIQTTCPSCNSNKMYFNVQKQIGLCHKASCKFHEKVFIEDLIKIFGFAPDEYGTWEPQKEEIERKPVVLPGYPILTRQGSRLLTFHQEALDYIRGRSIDDLVTLNWGLTSDGRRVYVPIFHEGCLYSYNSRILPRYELLGHKKYLYCSGPKLSKTILGWEECQHWSYLCLVENTFVSLALRYLINCSTVFGSSLSDCQADLIAESSINKVAILWDENTNYSSEKTIKKLHKRGVKANYWRILNQPDNYSTNWIQEKAKQVLKAADQGINWIDFRSECKQIKGENNGKKSI